MATTEPNPRSFLLGMIRDWGIAVLVVAIVVLGYGALMRPDPPALGPAPDFTLASVDGGSFTLSSETADVVILNFWFTTCPPCRAEIPELSKFHATHPEVPLYGVSTDVGMPTGRLKQAAERLGITYPVLHDVRAEVAGRYAVDVFPTTLVLKDGRIVSARVGAVTAAVLEDMVRTAAP